jgi:hypothetical protein
MPVVRAPSQTVEGVANEKWLSRTYGEGDSSVRLTPLPLSFLHVEEDIDHGS